jgi:hypothetical protein
MQKGVVVDAGQENKRWAKRTDWCLGLMFSFLGFGPHGIMMDTYIDVPQYNRRRMMMMIKIIQVPRIVSFIITRNYT